MRSIVAATVPFVSSYARKQGSSGGISVTTVLQKFLKQSRRRRRRAERSHQRLDIQGLRMVAVLTVFGAHLWGWPQGGFVGVDVFFVISGFLITGNLLRMAERNGNVSFKDFYWNRVRRIIPAATVVLILTYLASTWVFLPFRAEQVGMDSLFAFVFMSNWWFAVQETDYFGGVDAVSPIQHYWSLSVEEQFYFIWPALIFAIGLVIAQKAWTHAHRMRLAGAVMGGVVAASLGWALYETAAAPTWAYFNTFSRVWELGIGAMLATAVGALARIPPKMKPWLSWGGLAIIGASVLLINEDSVGFPAPWALLPVAGSAMVIAAGVGGEPRKQGFLRNPVSVYVGNISYSLYLVHWPVIVILGALMPTSGFFSLSVVALSFGLAIASYHFVENPLRYTNWRKVREAVKDVRLRRYEAQTSSRYAAVAVLFLVTLGVWGYTVRPNIHDQVAPPIVAAAPGKASPSEPGPDWGPLTAALQEEIAASLTATEWPPLDPSMESAMQTPESPPEVHACNGIVPLDGQTCTWGSASAPTQMVIVGDSIALSYAGPLRELALNSGGQIRLDVAAMGGCEFAAALVFNPDPSIVDACPGMTQRAVDLINSTKPEVVIISNIYGTKRVVGSDEWMTTREWGSSLRQIIEKFRGSTKEVVLLSAPPAEINIRQCYGDRSSVPASCISEVDDIWRSIARSEQSVAESVNGKWIDARPWFCSDNRFCPSFVGSTPTKLDTYHMTLAYGQKIHPMIAESMKVAGVF
ncbi:acyltransferase family protein [Mycolicibacterium vanbaalenii]|nr:acyltransferase family protein [Mycolicibacterium vanbaalenii]